MEESEFLSPFGKLDENNRWVKKASLIPWDRIEDRYAVLFESKTGNPGGAAPEASGSTAPEDKEGEAGNRGTLTLDATCVPADITYPTDMGL